MRIISILVLLVILSSCRNEVIHYDAPASNDLKIAFSSPGSDLSDGIITNLRLFTAGTDNQLYDTELLNLLKSTADQKVGCKIKTGDWHLAVVSAPAAYPVEQANWQSPIDEQLLYKYAPQNPLGNGHTKAAELFTDYIDLPLIAEDETKNVNASLTRNVARVQLIVKEVPGSINTASDGHRVYLHHIPQKIGYTGSLLPNGTVPDTLPSPVYAALPLMLRNGIVQGTDTLNFIIPAHKGDLTGDLSTHKMKLSVELQKNDGTTHRVQAPIPLTALCNQTLRINLTVNTSCVIEAGIHPWVDEEHNIELGRTHLKVNKTQVRMAQRDVLFIESNESIEIDSTSIADWLDITASNNNTQLNLSANFSTYPGTARRTSFIIKSGQIEKTINVEQLVSGAFETVWNITNDDLTALLPMHPDGEYDFTVDWGDGSPLQYLKEYPESDEGLSHTYASAGSYTVKINGKYKGLRFYLRNSYLNDPLKYGKQLEAINNWGCLEFTNHGEQFKKCNIDRVETADAPNLAGITNMTGWFESSNIKGDISNWDVSNITHMNHMFFRAALGCDISSWDVSSVVSMRDMFRSAKIFNEDISNWDVSNVTDMGNMFYYNFDFNNGGEPLNWGSATANVKDMAGMFKEAKAFNHDISSWDVSSVIDMSNMFDKNTVFNNGGEPLDWGSATANVKYMTYMFLGTKAFNQSVSGWDVSSLINTYKMFYEAAAFNNGGEAFSWATATAPGGNMSAMFQRAWAFNQSVNGLKVINVTNMSDMFNSATIFNNGGEPLNWGSTTANVTTMEEMFQYARAFNADISSWNVNNVTTMSRMFEKALAFNQDISSWNVSNVTSMRLMFNEANAFNQDVSSWDVINVNDMYGMFMNTTVFNNGDTGNNGAKPLTWGRKTAKVFTIGSMFERAVAFNQDISSWDLSSVTNMRYTFHEARIFNNGDVGNNGAKPLTWGSTTAKVQNMENTFLRAWSFNQDVSSWDVSSVTDMSNMFAETPRFNNGDTGNNGAKPLTWGTTTGRVKDMSYMFNKAWVFNQDVSSWDVSSVTNMVIMFSDARIFNQDISSWNVSSVTNMALMFHKAMAFNNGDTGNNSARPLAWGTTTAEVRSMSGMFKEANAFNQDISSWNVSSVTDMKEMFQNTYRFNSDISNWDVSRVTNMSYMLAQAEAFNQPIGRWGTKTGAVTNMSGMLQGTKAFNQDVSNWDVSNVTDISYIFNRASAFNNGGVALNWGTKTGKIVNMRSSFANATVFNQDISDWDVSRVTHMSYMFAQAEAFNQPIGRWGTKTGAVRYVSGMLQGALVFNQDISSWDISNVVGDMDYMFRYAAAFNNGGVSLNVDRNPQVHVSWDFSIRSVPRRYATFEGTSIANIDKPKLPTGWSW